MDQVDSMAILGKDKTKLACQNSRWNSSTNDSHRLRLHETDVVVLSVFKIVLIESVMFGYHVKLASRFFS